MTQLVPSVLLYGQALKLIEELEEGQKSGTLQDTDDLIAKLAGILTQFEDTAGSPFLRYEPVAETEPPSSAKTNRVWRSIEKDVNLLQQQLDILRAATSFSHNIVATEVMKSKAANARVSNKLKTLQLYTESVDSSVITFGDSFRSLEFTDTEMVPPGEQAALMGEGYMTLATDGEMVNLAEDAVISILSSSNGFLGNYHEIEDPSSAAVDIDTGAVWHSFKLENRIYNDLSALSDEEPNTWIEYEHYYLTEEQQRTGANFNFHYSVPKGDGSLAYVNWAAGPDDGVLKLILQMDFTAVKTLNSIEYVPYGLENNSNLPVLIKYVETSPNLTDWTKIYPGDIWIGTETNVQAARVAANVATEKAVWAFEARSVRYVRFHIEQPNPITTRVGHVYYVDEELEYKRVLGPIPPATEPDLYYYENHHNNFIQQREFFLGKRWAIGIRDISLQQREYTDRSVIVSKPLRVGGVVDRVALSRADIFVPAEYPTDQSWVEFYVSPDDGTNWFQISRIEDDNLGIPEQIAFNDPIPEAFRETGVAYYNVDNTVTTLRLKIILTRPDELVTTTPILRSYVLKVKRR